MVTLQFVSVCPCIDWIRLNSHIMEKHISSISIIPRDDHSNCPFYFSVTTCWVQSPQREKTSFLIRFDLSHASQLFSACYVTSLSRSSSPFIGIIQTRSVKIEFSSISYQKFLLNWKLGLRSCEKTPRIFLNLLTSKFSMFPFIQKVSLNHLRFLFSMC